MKRFVSFISALALAFAFLHRVEAKDTKKKSAVASPTNAPKFNVPIPVNHPATGVTIPYFDEHGKLQMLFKMETATRTDNEHLQMKSAQIQTYDQSGKPEMSIDLPSSVLDLNTKIVTSDVPVTVRRSDFEVTGETMQFDTDKRYGRLIGKVRMLIYNRDQMNAPSANHE